MNGQTLPIPQDVVDWIRKIFSTANDRLAERLSSHPNVHETSLDQSFIEYLSERSVPRRLRSDWVVQIETHFLGGGRHFEHWEIADIGLLVLYQRRGELVRSKVGLLQSKRLYPTEQEYEEEEAPGYMPGFGRLYVPRPDLALPRKFTFNEKCQYKALQIADPQYERIREYEQESGIPIYYLLYNPQRIPSSTTIPRTTDKRAPGPNHVGSRVIRGADLRSLMQEHTRGYVPRYADLKYGLGYPFDSDPHVAGWRLEEFVSELLVKCREGRVTPGPDDERLDRLFYARSGPIAGAIAVTFDAPE